jgi:hypothetical protein
MPELSKGLSLLLSHGSPGEAAEQIAADPALFAECRDNLPAIQAACEAALIPAGEANVAKAIGSRMAVYPQPDRSDDEWVAWWSCYYDALADLPAKSIEAAMLDWIRSPAQFLPKPGELRELARKKAVPEYSANYVAKLAMQRERKPMTREETEARRKEVVAALDMIQRAKPRGNSIA